MAKEKKDLSPEKQQKNAEKRNWIKFLRGQQRNVMTAVAATAALELGNSKVINQPEVDRKVEPVVQTVEAQPSQVNIDPTSPQIQPDTIVMPGVVNSPSRLEDNPVGLNPLPSEYPTPQIQVPEKDDWNYEETKELCDDLQYDICQDYINECDEAGYGKEKLDYEQKLELAGSAVSVEIGKVMSEDLLPVMDVAVKTVEKVGEYCDKVAGQNLKDPMIQARAERNGKEVAAQAKKYAGQTSVSYNKMAKRSQEIVALNEIQKHYEKTGEKTGENMLDKKISDMYKYSLKYVKEYDQKDAVKSVEKIALQQATSQKKVLDTFKRGGYE